MTLRILWWEVAWELFCTHSLALQWKYNMEKSLFQHVGMISLTSFCSCSRQAVLSRGSVQQPISIYGFGQNSRELKNVPDLCKFRE